MGRVARMGIAGAGTARGGRRCGAIAADEQHSLRPQRSDTGGTAPLHPPARRLKPPAPPRSPRRSLGSLRAPMGCGGAGRSAVLPLLADGSTSPSSRRLASRPAAPATRPTRLLRQAPSRHSLSRGRWGARRRAPSPACPRLRGAWAKPPCTVPRRWASWGAKACSLSRLRERVGVRARPRRNPGLGAPKAPPPVALGLLRSCRRAQGAALDLSRAHGSARGVARDPLRAAVCARCAALCR